MRGDAMGTMNVSLTKELHEYVETEVASGDFASASEVVRAGLRALRDERAVVQEKLEILRREIQIGVDDVEAGRFAARSVDEIADEVLRRHSL
jgi:antitoxin ParD1/3/4